MAGIWTERKAKTDRLTDRQTDRGRLRQTDKLIWTNRKTDFLKAITPMDTG